jgi:sortase A
VSDPHSPSSPPRRRRRRRVSFLPGLSGPRSARRRAEIALFLVAFVCLGIWGWSALDSYLYQAYESWHFTRELESRPAAPSAPLAPAPAPAALPAALPADEGSSAAATPPAHPEPAEGESLGRLEAPRLGISVMVAQGVSGPTLRRSAGHIPGTALPGESGNVGIAGHRDTFFRPLKDVRKDDALILTTLQGTYRYVVDSTTIVTPEDVEVLDPQGRPTLTLVTCYPFYYVGSAPQRFIVQAHLAS